MENFELYLHYQKEITESKLKTINRLLEGAQPKPQKRTSKINVVENVLKIAGRPLHVSEIIKIAERDFPLRFVAIRSLGRRSARFCLEFDRAPDDPGELRSDR